MKSNAVKLITILLKDRLDADHWSNEVSIRNMITTYHLNIEIIEREGHWRLRPEKKWVWHLLKLLADDYARSERTGNRYELYGKRSIG